MNIRLHPLMLVAAIALAFTVGWSASDAGSTRTARAVQPVDDFFSEVEDVIRKKIDPPEEIELELDDDFFGDPEMDGVNDLRSREHLEVLAVLEGRWAVSVRVFEPSSDEPIEMTGVVEREWVLDGLWLREELVADNDDFAYSAISFLGYSIADGTYQQVVVDSVSTAAYLDNGYLNRDTGVLVSIGSYRDEETGELIHTRTKFDLSDGDRHRFVIYEIGSDGQERTAVQGVYERD